MTERYVQHHVVIDDGNRPAAAADVITPGISNGTVRVSLRAESGHIRPGTRSSLVDAVLDLPGVQDSARLEAVVPLGDSESLHRLQERCEDVRIHAAGSSALVDASLPPRSAPPGSAPPGSALASPGPAVISRLG